MNHQWSIKKLGYSSNPWRLIGSRGEEIYEEVVMDHPILGRTRVSAPVCGNTKSEVVDRVLQGYAKMQSVIAKRTEAIRIIQTWARCDSSSFESRKKAMDDIANKCNSALE